MRQGWERLFSCSFFCLPKRKNQIIKNVFCSAKPNKEKGTFTINFSGRHRVKFMTPRKPWAKFGGLRPGFPNFAHLFW